MEPTPPEIDPRKRNSAVLCGVLAALFSLPMRWMTLRDAEVTYHGNGFAREFAAALGGPERSDFDLTALNGNLFGGAVPFWVLAMLVMGVNVLLLVRRSRLLYVPEWLPLVASLVTAAFLLVPLLVAGSVQAELGPGWLLCFGASLVPLAYLFRERSLIVAWREEHRRHERDLRRATLAASRVEA